MSNLLQTKWLGIDLRSPVVAASSGMTDHLDKLRQLEDSGVGAVVLKSLFEEEILAEMQQDQSIMQRPGPVFPEVSEMEDFLNAEDGLSTYLELVRSAAAALDIPVVASINCISSQKWTHFARMIQDAGAAAIELNVFLMPSDFDAKSVESFEATYFEIIREVLAQVTIPVSVKLGYHFTLLGQTLQKISESGVAGMVLFNRFFYPDYDLDTLQIVPTNVLSTPEDLPISLKWIAIMAGRVSCDLAASTGVHDGDGVIKQILAGAQVVQIASVLYRQGPQAIAGIHKRIGVWMETMGHHRLEEFRGTLSQLQLKNPAAYERVQFLKNYRSFR